VRYTVAGATSLERFVELIDTMAVEADRYEDRCVLVDVRRVMGRLSTSEQIQVGEMVASQLAGVYKMASLVPPGEISGNSERAAAKLGMQLRVFSVEASALLWLLDRDPDHRRF
jgi:hypothetical protein